jgi:hypothetical protein
MLCGSITMESNDKKAFRYQLCNKAGMIKLRNCINGHIRHETRLLQLHRVCQVLDIPPMEPIALDAQSNWFAGFFDADGHIGINMRNPPRGPELRIVVTNKLRQDVESWKVVFGGNIYLNRNKKEGCYRWWAQSRKDVLFMLSDFQSSTWRSHKARRFLLIEEFYRLMDLRALKPESIHNKEWLAFLDKWNQ